jgi:hypothetical protein
MRERRLLRQGGVGWIHTLNTVHASQRMNDRFGESAKAIEEVRTLGAGRSGALV